MKNVLIIPPFNPYPLISGGHQAVFNGIAILKDIANVYVIVSVTQSQYTRGEHESLRIELPFVHIIPFVLPNSKHTLKWFYKVCCNKLGKLLPEKKGSRDNRIMPSFDIYTVGDTWPEMNELMISSIKKYKIDIVQTEMLYEMGLVKRMPDSVRKIFIHHEICFVRNQLALSQCRNVFSMDTLAVEKEKKNEIRLLNMYDDVVTLSDIDRIKLEEAGVTTPITASLAVVRIAETNKEVVHPVKVLSFVGPSFHSPNYEGVLWFLNHCWKQLKIKESEYSLRIIGKWSDEAKNVVEQFDDVSCLGFVENLSEVLIGTTMIVPLTIGSGIRMKILEAANFSVPVVSTSVGAEGLPLINGTHIFVADDPNVFVEDILKLEDTQIRDRFVANTKEVINHHYSLDTLLESRIALYL